MPVVSVRDNPRGWLMPREYLQLVRCARRLADRRFEVRKYRDSAGAVSAQVVVWLRGSRVVAISCGMWHRLTVNDALKICHPRDLLRHAFYFLPVPNV
jgi:hypothetical protein